MITESQGQRERFGTSVLPPILSAEKRGREGSPAGSRKK
jgi:hypothetical protein